MARGVNKVILVGNLGADPETRYTAGGAAITNIRIATTESWRDNQTGENQERTEWHRVVFFSRLAEANTQVAGPERPGSLHHRNSGQRNANAGQPGGWRRSEAGTAAVRRVQG
jgi:hypothetical protein